MLKKIAAMAVVALGLVPLLPASAQARTPVRYTIDVAADMSAVGTVYDDTFHGTYLGSIQATGSATCSPTGPTVQLADYDLDDGNPLVLSTDGTCVPYLAEATYVMEWAALPGISGQHVVECVWLFYDPVCTLRGVDTTFNESGMVVDVSQFEHTRTVVLALLNQLPDSA